MIRRRLRRMYQQGYDNALNGPTGMDPKPEGMDEFDRWAWRAGVEDGKRRREELALELFYGKDRGRSAS